MRKFRFPNTYVIISAIILICAVATWFVPGGQYVTGPDGTPSFGSVDSVPQTWQVFSALYEGFVKQAGIIVFILVVGGSFWLLNSTGAVEYGIRKFIGRVGRYDKLVLASIAVLFSLGGAVFGMSEETIPFVGIVVPLVVSMGYDAIVGLLVVYVASNIGFSSAFLNPFTVGIAQEMSGLPMFSGMGYRLVCWAVLTAALVVFTLVYASGVRKQPAAVQSRAGCDGTPTVRKRIVLGILLLTVIALIVGVVRFKWYMPEISALFLAMGVLCGVAGGLRPGRIADEFMAGAKDIFPAAMVVGLASGIVVILQDGKILDTLLHSLELSVGDSSPLASLSAMYGLQALVNLVIPSATAKAAITIPIMAPFADMIGLSRQATVLAFQFGDGFTNMITPTSGVLIAALAMAKVPYSEWVHRAWKPVLVLLAAGFLLLVPTVLATIPEF